MKILVIGGGGREHAIIKTLSQSNRELDIYACPGNGGIANEASCINIQTNEFDKIIDFCKLKNIDLVYVSPDEPLVNGLVDRLICENINAFGPSKSASKLEGSKIFAKEFMTKYGINTSPYKVFTDSSSAINYVNKIQKYPIVIKMDGLALGKGVIIAKTKKQAIESINKIMNDNIFNSKKNNIIIEDFIDGIEVSILALCDGKTIIPISSFMDHKKAFEDDKGPNTGGMGVITPNPYYTEKVSQICQKEIYEKTLFGLSEENIKYKGIIYFGLMISDKDIYLLEYNCRLGDPEAQLCLQLIETDLIEIIEHINKENLKDINININNTAGACVIMASNGYPDKYTTGHKILGLKDVDHNVTIYHAGTKLVDQKYFTTGGRVLGVTALSPNLKDAIEVVYNNIVKIKFNNSFYRKDIGKSAL